MIGPVAIGGGTKDDCDGDKVKNSVDTDDDNDLIPDTLEATARHRPVRPRHRRRRRVRRLGVLLGARPQRQGQAGSVRPALPEPAGRQGRRHRPRWRRPDRHPGVQRVGELRRQQAAPELLGRQPGLGRPRRPARRHGLHGPRPQRLPERLRARRRRRRHPQHGRGRLEGRSAPHYGPAERRSELLRLRALHPVLHRPRRRSRPTTTTRCARASTRCRSTARTSCRTRSRRRRSIPSTGCRPTRTATAIRDDADDQDHDDVPNITEYLQEIAAPFKDRKYRQLDACIPNSDSRFCLLGSADVDGDGIANRDDTDDDGDGLPDTLETALGTDPLRADSDSDGVSDGYEYWSALDLNGAAHPFPGKAPYPNALDGTDAGLDFDGDGLTLKQEYQAWNYSGRPLPLNYSDGNPCTGGSVLRDGAKDVDGDGLTNFEETSGPMRIAWWAATVRRPERAQGDAVPGRRPPLRRAELHRPGHRRRRHPGRQRRPGPRRLPELVRGRAAPPTGPASTRRRSSRGRRPRGAPTRWRACNRSTPASRSTATPATTPRRWATTSRARTGPATSRPPRRRRWARCPARTPSPEHLPRPFENHRAVRPVALGVPGSGRGQARWRTRSPDLGVSRHRGPVVRPGGASRRGCGGACPPRRPTGRAWSARGARARRGAAR